MSNKNDEMAGVSRSETEESRRAFLKKAGKFAVYTPPAVMLLMKPSFAHINKSYCGRPGNASSGSRNSDIVGSAFFGDHR